MFEVAQNMPWEMRAGGSGPYYTRSRRRDGKTVREYLGRGPVAELAAAADAEARVQKAAERQALVELTASLDEADEPAERFRAIVRLLMHAALVADGCHLHSRSTWRRRRLPVQGDSTASANS